MIWLFLFLWLLFLAFIWTILRVGAGAVPAMPADRKPISAMRPSAFTPPSAREAAAGRSR